MKILKYMIHNKAKLIFIGFSMFITNLVIFLSLDTEKIVGNIIYLNDLLGLVAVLWIIVDYNLWKRRVYGIYKILEENENINSFDINGRDFQSKLIRRILELKEEEEIQSEGKYKESLDKLNDYVTKWTHEVKTPIAVSNLIFEKDNLNLDDYDKLKKEMGKVEYYVEQMLYMSRASSYEEDLTVSQINLKRLVSRVIKKNMNLFIYKNIEIELENLNIEVSTDSKWLSYIIEQVLNNSAKYSRENGKIKILAHEDSKYIILRIIDNGIGISKKNIDRIFDRGFSGDEGYNLSKSTGMGLYICKNMCDKLGYKINVTSEKEKYTEIAISINKYQEYLNI